MSAVLRAPAGTDGTAVTPTPQGHPLAIELAVTAAHRAAAGDRVERELACLRAMYPAVMRPIRPEDLFAGRIGHPLVGFGPEPHGLGFFCRADGVRAAMASPEWTDHWRAEADAMLAYWKGRTTSEKTRAAYSPALAAALPSDDWMGSPGVAFPLYRMAGTHLDYGRLLQRGIVGLREEVAARRDSAADAEAYAMLTGMLGVLEILVRIGRHYQQQATDLARQTNDPRAAAALARIAASCGHVISRAPETLHEAIELMWLYALFTGTWNYGRMDVYLGPFLARDRARGMLDDAEALALLQSFWRLIAAHDNMFNNRVIIGGVGRPDATTADRFALLAIAATRTVPTNQPQLTLRFHRGQDPALLDRAYDALGEGRTFPMLYNDEVNVPAVMRAFQVDRAEAEQYVPFGCGEYVLEHRSIGTPSGVMNLTHALNVALRDTAAVKPDASFEDLWAAYAAGVDRAMEALAIQEKLEYDVVAGEANFLALSLLYDDCLARGRPIFGGGARYLGGTIETYGNTNAADSLAAIHEVVYRQRACTLGELAAACAADFHGSEPLRKLLQDAPKYGNDDEAADAMAVRVHEHVCQSASRQAAQVGLHSYLVVIINNSANTVLGKQTGASPDGRSAGAPLANANNPAPGRDRHGVTAFLNSLVKLDPGLHAGAVQNMKFARSLFTAGRAKLRALLEVYFQRGSQAMITVVKRADLESALREPEKWGHLMVRVGGFSIRFVDLPRDVQLEVLERTLHE